MDPYRPPATPLPEPPRAAPTGFRFLPVFVGGFVIDYLGSSLIGAIAVVAALAVMGARGTSPEQATRDAASLFASPAFLWATMGTGALLTVLGAYVAARWAANRFFLHAAVAGSIALVLGSLSVLLGEPAPGSSWIMSFGFAAQIPLALAGGWLAQRRALRLRQNQPHIA